MRTIFFFLLLTVSATFLRATPNRPSLHHPSLHHPSLHHFIPSSLPSISRPPNATLNQFLATDADGNSNACSFMVTVEEKPKPNCAPPADVTVSCEQFDPSLLAYGEPQSSGSCCIQSVTKSANYSQFDTICQRGTITRTFGVVECGGGTSQYTQRVVVNYKQDYYIKFPDDVYSTFCDGNGNYGEPTFFGEDCELLAVSYTDQNILPVPDACFIILRDWTIINWCTYNPQVGLSYVPNPKPSPFQGHPTNLPGPIISTCGTAPPWASTLVKITPSDPAATDYCTFWNANANGYQYTQSIKIIDSAPPTFSNCPAQPSFWADSTSNDPKLWNNVFDPALPAQDLRETPIDLSVTVTDACSGSNINIEYLLFLDLDANGQQETVVNSTTLGVAGLGWNKVLYNNIATPNFSGGTPTTFDDRPVPTVQKYGFSIKESIVGVNKTASLRWNTELSPNTHILPELPNGRHKIKWLLTDGCGNSTECEQPFSIGDTTLVGTYTPNSEGFALYQNEPNPFGRSTTIRFQLPESTSATLSVFDAEGRVLYRQTADYGQGSHAITLGKEQIGSAGLLFYKLEAGANIAWRKMVVLR